MPTGCCSNCFSKYSFLNPENGCSSCAYSFCGKCVGFRAMMPRLANKPVSVCKKCFDKLEGEKNRPQVAPSGNPSGESRPGNWWGEGLPPPSLRNMIGNQPPPRPIAGPRVVQNSNAIITVEPLPDPPKQDQEFEKRLEQLKHDESAPPALSIEEIEERLAALRGIDVELVRNPRLWFEKSESASDGLDPHVALIKKAQDEAQIEMDHDKRLEERARALKDDREEGAPEIAPEVPPHASESAEFSGATKEEMEQIKRLLEDAEKRNSSENEKREKEGDDVDREVKDALAAVRREKSKAKEEAESDDESMDEETLKRIVAEAENAPDELALEETAPVEEPQKKKGFLRKLFKK